MERILLVGNGVD